MNFNDGRFERLSKIAYLSMTYADSLQSYPNGTSNRAPGCIPPGFFCLSVSPFPSIPVATSTNPRGTLWDLGFTDLRRATSKWNTLLWGTAYAVVESRVGSDRFVTSLFLSPPHPILNSEFRWNRWKSFLWSCRVLSPSERVFPGWRREGETFYQSFFNLKHYRSARR